MLKEEYIKRLQCWSSRSGLSFVRSNYMIPEEIPRLSRSRGVLDSKSGMKLLEAYKEVTRSNL
jgi:hypothetical protein